MRFQLRGVSSLTRSTWLAIFAVVAICGLFTNSVDAKLKDGKLATKLEEYQSTIKCMLNIAEDTLPELDDYVGCCGFWALHDFLIHKVDKECDKSNLDQVKHVSGLMAPRVREHCAAYPQGSFTCRLLVIMPITFGILFIIFLVVISVCACVSFCKWRNTRTKYRKAKQTMADNGVRPPTYRRNISNDAFRSDLIKPLKGASKVANNP